MRQETDVRYVVTSLEGDAERLYDGVLPPRTGGEPDQAAQGATRVRSYVNAIRRPPIRCA